MRSWSSHSNNLFDGLLRHLILGDSGVQFRNFGGQLTIDMTTADAMRSHQHGTNTHFKLVDERSIERTRGSGSWAKGVRKRNIFEAVAEVRSGLLVLEKAGVVGEMRRKVGKAVVQNYSVHHGRLEIFEILEVLLLKKMKILRKIRKKNVFQKFKNYQKKIFPIFFKKRYFFLFKI